MFKNKSFNVKVIDDQPQVTNMYVPPRLIDYDKISEVLWVQTRNVALCVGAIVVAKNLSSALGLTVRDLTWRIVDAKVPYPPISR